MKSQIKPGAVLHLFVEIHLQEKVLAVFLRLKNTSSPRALDRHITIF